MDAIFRRFLESAYSEAMELAEASDVLTLVPIPPQPPSTYLCEFRVQHLRRAGSGIVKKCDGTVVCALHFHEDFLRTTDPRLSLEVASLISPGDFVHPNVSEGTICLGYRFAPGTRIALLLRGLYEIVSYSNYTLDEHNSLNAEACRLLRAQPRLTETLTPEPLLRRRRKVRIEVKER